MLEWYLALGDTEIANHARLDAYLRTVGSSLDVVEACGCPTFTPDLVGDLPYSTPEEDQAPWYDPDVPESGEFAGLMVLTVEGLDEHPVTRTVTGAAAGGAVLGPARVQARTITVTGVLLGSSCCGVDYGLHWLSRALEGCEGGCEGDCLTLYNCCPGEGVGPEEFNARHRRTLRRVALTDGPRVIARTGDGCTTGTCSSGADLLTVEFVLTAATPWLWTDPVPVMDLALPGAPVEDDCAIRWCVHRPGDTAPCEGNCRNAPCVPAGSLCADPACLPPAPPVPTAPDTCYCLPVTVESACHEVDLSHRPGASDDVPVIRVRAGSEDLHRVTLTFYERSEADAGVPCDDLAWRDRCEPHSVYHIGYVPAGGEVLLDGQVGRALVQCGGECEPSQDVWGREGNPPTWARFTCASYCLCVEVDAMYPPAADALVEVAVSGRGY